MDMGTRELFVLVVTVVCGLVLGQDCLLNRLDVLPCDPLRASSFPQQNQYAIYATRRVGGSQCRYRNPNRDPDHEVIVDISTLGTDELKFIHSPGFLTGTSYPDEILEEYNIQCGGNRIAFFNLTTIDLQAADCNGRCVDYIEIDRGQLGVIEICGTNTSNSQIQLDRSFTMLFRSSDSSRFPGFQAYIICFDPMEADAPGCTEVESTLMRRSVSWDDQDSRRGTRASAAFHQVWKDWCPDCKPQEVVRTELVIQSGEGIQYRSKVISITSGERELARISDVAELRVIEGREEDVYRTHALNCGTGRFTVFPGPANLVVVGSEASLVVIEEPSAAEAEVIASLMQGLYTLLDPEVDDVIIDFESRNATRGAKRSITSPSRGKRQILIGEDMLSDETVTNAILNENACDAVLRTAARATLVVANRENSTQVDILRMRLFVPGNFTSP